MRVVIQRVTEASVSIDNKVKAKIEQGLLVLLGIEAEDNQDDINWLCKKIVNLRVFEDDSKAMNRSLADIDGEILVVSQFTLHASTKKGNRPSFIKAAKPEIAEPLYHSFLNVLKQKYNLVPKVGVFGAMMKINLVNDGPVTIIMDSKSKY